MDTTRWTIVGAVSVSLVAVAIFWATLPESGPPAVAASEVAPVAKALPAQPPSVKPSPRPSRPGPRAARNAKAPRGPDAGADAPRGRRGKAGKARSFDGEDVPEDVLEMIEEARAERVVNSAEKLATYAELANWDARTTENVQSLVQTAHDEVDTLIADATAGDVPWTDVRGEVRRIRLDQARAVRDELGEEEFRRFAKAMGRSRSRRGGRR